MRLCMNLRQGRKESYNRMKEWSEGDRGNDGDGVDGVKAVYLQ